MADSRARAGTAARARAGSRTGAATRAGADARAGSRARARAAALADAARVSVPARCDVCVVGAGASGLAAAIAAARAGATVVVLERAHTCGRTILATGNGRCNLANANLTAALAAGSAPVAAYHNAAFAAAAMGDAPTADIVRRFDRLGLDVTADADGRLYPASRAAESVRAVLLGACDRLGVVCAPARAVRGVARRGDAAGAGGAGAGEGAAGAGAGAAGELVASYDELWPGGEVGVRLACASVVVATGGVLTGGAPAAAHAGGSLADDLAALGLACVAGRPALCPLACTDVPAAIDGRRVRGCVTLLRGGNAIAREAGEVLFRTHGLSGIAVFNLSRVAEPGDVVSLDLVPTWTESRLHDRLRHLSDTGVPLDVQLAGLVDPVVARELAARAGGAAASHVTRRRAVRLLKGLRFMVRGTADETHAQVTRGGIDVVTLDATTLAVRDPRGAGVFACGEAVDVDGPCGGFNLAWAWQSGTVAGASAARWAASV